MQHCYVLTFDEYEGGGCIYTDNYEIMLVEKVLE